MQARHRLPPTPRRAMFLKDRGTAWAGGRCALGRPVWLLLAYDGTPQWGTIGEHWADFPTMRIFRLKHHGGRWPDLFAVVSKQLWRLTPAAAAR
jgi:hypothetical protein